MLICATYSGNILKPHPFASPTQQAEAKKSVEGCKDSRTASSIPALLKHTGGKRGVQASSREQDSMQSSQGCLSWAHANAFPSHLFLPGCGRKCRKMLKKIVPMVTSSLRPKMTTCVENAEKVVHGCSVFFQVMAIRVQPREETQKGLQ